MAIGASTIIRGSLVSSVDVYREYDGGGTFAANDLVSLISGKLQVTAAGLRSVGVAVQPGTNTTLNNVVNITPFLTLVMDNDNDNATFAANMVGMVGDIIGASGAQLVDTSTLAAGQTTTNTGQLVVLEYNPQGIRSDLDTDLSIGLVMIREHQFGTGTV